MGLGCLGPAAAPVPMENPPGVEAAGVAPKAGVGVEPVMYNKTLTLATVFLLVYKKRC